MLTRRMRRQAVSSLWPGTTKLTHAEFQLDHACDYFRWRTDNGRELTEAVPREKSWRQWRDQVATVRIDGAPTSLLRHPEWLLPFMIVYPHRADRRLTALADALIGRRARLEGV